MYSDFIQLDRTFSIVSSVPTDYKQSTTEFLHPSVSSENWSTLEKEYRVVILAAAGVGKTVEMKLRARLIRESGRFAFFIPIEALREDNLELALEIGSLSEFNQWLSSNAEAWFFLDSVDEARLTEIKAYEHAIKRFAMKIKNCIHRAHIYISARPYAWRFITDRQLINQYFPFSVNNSSNQTYREDSINIYHLNPLQMLDVRFYASQRGVTDTDAFINEILRANLSAIASRPFDLEFLITTWQKDRKLGSRLKLFENNITKKLSEIDPNREQAQPLNINKAIQGVEILAAAITLTAENGIKVPDKTRNQNGVDAKVILATWEPKDIQALLERGIFSDVLYGKVGFRHREIREYLAAQWLRSLLHKGHSRRAIESLIFKEIYGKQVIAPRMRPLLPWLILFDDEIRQKIVNLEPEIALEGGDISYLPVNIRKKMLNDIVTRIATYQDERNLRYNENTALIAKEDLTPDIASLIDKYYANDAAIFFLSKLLWQANIPIKLDKMAAIAVDQKRNVYIRIAAFRAVMATDSYKNKITVWRKINQSSTAISFKLLAGMIVQGLPLDKNTGELLLGSLTKLEPYQRHEHTGLEDCLDEFIEHVRQSNNEDYKSSLVLLIQGIIKLLKQPPLFQNLQYVLSQKYLWLLPFAICITEKLVLLRSNACFDDQILELLLTATLAKDYPANQYQLHKYKNKLHEEIPTWPELNDMLFWKAINLAREKKSVRNQRVVTDGVVQWPNPFFSFSEDSFDRVIQFIRQKTFIDDKRVALSLAFRIANQSENRDLLLDKLQNVITSIDIVELKISLDQLVNPQPCPETEEFLQQQQKVKRQDEKNIRERQQWIKKLRADPEQIRNPSGIVADQISEDQFLLLIETKDHRGNHLGRGCDWQKLIETFGNDVACAFRDAAMAYWRTYTPKLASDGGLSCRTPYSLIFGLAGLEIEAKEKVNFPTYLTQKEINHALLYTTKEMNGFPDWLEKMYLTYPEPVLATLWKELQCQLGDTSQQTSLNYILHDIAYRAPWSHSGLADKVFHWLMSHETINSNYLPDCLQILINSEIPTSELSLLAKTKIDKTSDKSNRPLWFALYVDTQPAEGINALSKELAALTKDAACDFAQHFITCLTGSLHKGNKQISFTGQFYQAPYLKSLYLLMYKYINPQQDLQRANSGVYSPTLRDHAQEGRDLLVQWLANIAGKEAFIALTELANEHPDRDTRLWMEKLAHNRAVSDADIASWSDKQISDFAEKLTFDPESTQQLYDIGVQYLLDYKDWLERGNDSLAETYQKISKEVEMRNVVTHYLNQKSNSRFTCAQEAELANKQRCDILLQHPKVNAPVPIELKLLDKEWSGEKLCERLRNQLVGDYLRENGADFGIFLLIWQGNKANNKWIINGENVTIDQLEKALQLYWRAIENDFTKIKAIEVIVIDLTKRAEKSST